MSDVRDDAADRDTRSRYELTSSQRDLQASVRAIARSHFAERSLEWEEQQAFPWENLRLLADAGVMGLAVPIEFGGTGGSWLDSAIVLEEIARCCYVTAMACLAELGVQTRSIVAYGSDDLKRRLLPGVVRGDTICSICMTEPDVGSDLASVTTTATRRADGLCVRGTKALISRADVASVFLVCVRFSHGHGLDDVGFVVVESERDGLEVERADQTLGGEHLFQLRFDDVVVPEENVLAGPGQFRRLLSAFNGQRCLNAAISVGIAQGALDAGVRRSAERQQFGRPIAEFQGIRWMLADCAIEIEAARSLVHRAAWAGGCQFPDRVPSAVAKVAANEMALRVTDRVVQVYGGHGYLRRMPAERYLRWARYGALGGGTPQLLRDGIARDLLSRAPA